MLWCCSVYVWFILYLMNPSNHQGHNFLQLGFSFFLEICFLFQYLVSFAVCWLSWRLCVVCVFLLPARFGLLLGLDSSYAPAAGLPQVSLLTVISHAISTKSLKCLFLASLILFIFLFLIFYLRFTNFVFFYVNCFLLFPRVDQIDLFLTTS